MEQKDPPEDDRRTHGQGGGVTGEGWALQNPRTRERMQSPWELGGWHCPPGAKIARLRGESDLRWPQPAEAWSRVSAPEVME